MFRFPSYNRAGADAGPSANVFGALGLLAVQLAVTVATLLLLWACGGEASSPPLGPTPTPRPATADDRALIRSALADAAALKSFHKSTTVTDTLLGVGAEAVRNQASEVYVTAPGEFYAKAYWKGKPLEVLGTGSLLYTRDGSGNWVLNEQEELASQAELWINTSFGGPIEDLEEGQAVLDTQIEEEINGARARRYTWQKKNETGWFTGSTSIDTAWIDPVKKRLHKLISCTVLDKDPSKAYCITWIITGHNESVEIPKAPPTPAVRAHYQATATAPLCGAWDIQLSSAARSDPKQVQEGDSGFNAVLGLAPDDVWAAGFKIDRWNGKEWTNYPFPVTGEIEINDLAAVARDDVWAVGSLYEGNGRGLALHWNGKEWQDTADKSFMFRPIGVAAIASNDVWAVGSDSIAPDRAGVVLGTPTVHSEGISIMHWNGQEWRRVPISDRPMGSDLLKYGALSDVVAIKSNDVWAVGHSDVTAVLMHWDGSVWTVVPEEHVCTNCALTAVSAASANDIWIVPGFWHWDGKALTQASFEAASDSAAVQNVSAVSAVSGNDAWAVGSNVIWHWDGKIWRQLPNPVAELTSPSSDGVTYGWLAAVSGLPSGAWVAGPIKPTGGNRFMVARFVPGQCNK